LLGKRLIANRRGDAVSRSRLGRMAVSCRCWRHRRKLRLRQRAIADRVLRHSSPLGLPRTTIVIHFDRWAPARPTAFLRARRTHRASASSQRAINGRKRGALAQLSLARKEHVNIASVLLVAVLDELRRLVRFALARTRCSAGFARPCVITFFIVLTVAATAAAVLFAIRVRARVARTLPLPPPIIPALLAQ